MAPTKSTSSSIQTSDSALAPSARASPAASPPSSQRARTPRNWYFTLVRFILCCTTLTVALSGALHVYMGAQAFNLLGAVLTRECTDDQALNGLWRFFAVMWLSYAPLCILLASDLVRFAPVLRLLLAATACAGAARAATAWLIGVPGTPMGYFATYIACFFEITTPLVAAILLQLGLRLQKKRA